jgi:hypothetical protein
MRIGVRAPAFDLVLGSTAQRSTFFVVIAKKLERCHSEKAVE